MDVKLPDGTIVRNVPEGTTKAQIMAKMQSAQRNDVPQWGQDNPSLYGIAGATRETLGPVLEATGLIGGGALGAPAAGPVGAVAGAGLGYGAAKAGTGWADVQLGNRSDPNLMGAAQEGLSNVAEGSMMEAGGQSIVPLAKAAWGGVKGAINPALDVLTGAGNQTFRRIADAGREGGARLASVMRNMRGQEPMEAVVADAKNALRNMHDTRSAQYLDDMAKFAEAEKPIDFKLVDDAFKELVDSFKFRGEWKVGKETQTKMGEIAQTISRWRQNPELHTTVGFDALKQRINDLMPNKLDAGRSGAAVTRMYNAIKDTITRESPEYAKAMKEYEASITQTKAIERELSLGNRASEETALRKLQSISRNNANTSYGNRQTMAEMLEQQGGADILDRVAGQSASSVTPRGLARLLSGGAAYGGATINPALLAALPATSPRLMGEAALLTGRGASTLERLLPRELAKQLAQGTYFGMNQEQ